jgi:hypothetical protein
MFTRFNNFKEDLLLESIVNESILHYSPPLRSLISKVGGDIGKALLDAEKTDIKPDVTFVDLDKEGYLSFTTMKNAMKVLKKQYPDADEKDWEEATESDIETLWRNHKHGIENDVYNKSRNSLKIGKLINKIFPGKFKDKDIEDFVNKMKAGSSAEGENLELVEGKEIAHWYKYDNYAEIKGSLGSSCMRNMSENTFRIYIENPEVCRMLILKEDDKILGRALIWKVDSIKKWRDGEKLEGVEYFMDRQYTIKDSDVEKFREYAKEKGWAYKAYNNHHSFLPIFVGDEEIKVDMTVQLKKADSYDYDYSNYPYLDTFRRYNPQTGILYNDEDDESSNEGMYILDDTGGGYRSIESGVWSEYYDRMIPEDDAVYSDWLETYILSDDSVHVTEGERRHHGYYPSDYDDIVYDEWADEYIHVNDGVYSDWYGYWLLRDNAVHVIVEIESDGDVDEYNDNFFHMDDNDIINIDEDMDWYEFLSEKHSGWREYSYILEKIMVEDLNNDWVPKKYAIEVYPVGEAKPNSIEITGIEYLTEFDAEILGYELNLEDPQTIDQFHYHKDLEPILPKLYKRLSDVWIKAAQEVSGKGQLRIKFKDFNEDDYIKSKWDIIKKYGDRLEQLEDDEFIEIDPEKITITRHDIADDLARN